MYKAWSVLLVLILLISGCFSFEKKEEEQAGDEAIVLQPDVEVVAENLSVPWSIDMVNGTFYISERTEVGS